MNTDIAYRRQNVIRSISGLVSYIARKYDINFQHAAKCYYYLTEQQL